MTRIYLDHAATSPLRAEAAEAMRHGFEIWGNPSSPHAEGRKARAALEDARERVKAALGWEGECIFTSGASEALAIGLGRAKVERRIVSAVEHDAVFRAAPGAEVVRVTPQGFVDRAALAEALDRGPAVCAIQHVNSETGTMQDFAGLRGEVNAAGSLLLSDCSQSAAGHVMPEADMIVVSAHKLGGPIGCGALLVRDFALLHPEGGHERGYRQGTENLPDILGLACALEASRGMDGWTSLAVNEAFDAARTTLREAGGEEVAPGLWSSHHISSFAHPTMSAQAQLIRLDAMGFAVSAGSACSSGTLKKSRVLDAFGIDDDTAARTIRVSIGWNTTPAELAAFAEAWRSL